MEYVRVFSDAAGESHLETVELVMSLTDFAPPAPAFAVAPFMAAARCSFCAPAAGWFGDWHPTPTRQIFYLLRGIWEVTVSDGAVRRLQPGSAVMLADTTGKGHTTRIIGDEDAFAGIVQLPD
jgi:hypothetical protein